MSATQESFRTGQPPIHANRISAPSAKFALSPQYIYISLLLHLVYVTSTQYMFPPLDNFIVHFHSTLLTLFRSPGSSRYFSYHPDTFRIIWTPCRPSADFLCISSDYSQDHLDVFRMIQIISRYSEHPASQPAKTSNMKKNSPVSIAEALTRFF